MEVLEKPELLDTDTQAEALAVRALIFAARKDGKQARALAEQAAALAGKSEEPSILGLVNFGLAAALWADGDRARALAAADRALESVAGAEDAFLQGRIVGWKKGKE